jgi:hypothetical protein
MKRSTVVNPKGLADEVATDVVAGLPASDAARLRELIGELVRDWFREAGTGKHAPAVFALLRRQLAQSLADVSAAARVDTVHAAVLDRRIRRLSVQTLRLGQEIIDGRVSRDDARALGESLLPQIEAVAAEVHKLADKSVGDQLGLHLQEVGLEALYAIDGEIMSHRLSHYIGRAPAHRRRS